MRRLVLTATVTATLLGCTPPHPTQSASSKPEQHKSDAREPTRRELEARLAKIETQLLVKPRSRELLRTRLELTIALALLGREPPEVRPPSADALVRRARERLEELARARSESDEREAETKRELEEREKRRQSEERERAEADGEGARQRGDKKGGEQDDNDPLGGPWDGGKDKPKQSGSAPPPPPAEEGPGGVRAARVLPSAQGSSAEVSRQIERHADRLASCVPVTARASGLRCEVRVRLDERGRFREPRVLAADLDPRVGSCIADVFRDMRLDSPAGDSHVVTVPLWLPPNP